MRYCFSTVKIAFVVLFISLVLGLSPASAIVDVSIGLNFRGSSQGIDSFSTPSDCNGTIGPNHFVEFINGAFAVYDRTNGSRIFFSTDMDFWSNAGITFGPGVYVSDPRLIYDSMSGRWFACMIDVTTNQLNNRYLLAVSKTSDPTQGWNATTIPSDLNRFADFPTLGLDANAVYLGADSFDSLNRRRVSYISIPKTDLLGPVLDVSRRTSSGALSVTTRGNTPHPVVNLGGTTPGLILSTESNGTDFLPHSIIKLVQVNGSGAAVATFSSAVNITVPTYTVPINPSQPDVTRSALDDGDCRFGSKPYQIGNTIYAVHTVNLPNGTNNNPHAGIRWYKIDATAKTLIQSGTISNAVDLFYPSICANSNGVVVINMNGCSTNQYISSYAAVGETVGNATVFGETFLMKAGTASYDGGGGFGDSRWGDYSAVTPDPNNADHFWAIQNLATGVNQWSTQITEIIAITVVPPFLTIGRSSSGLMIQWVTPVSGFVLEETTSLDAPIVWQPVTSQAVNVSGTNSVFLPLDKAIELFRLRR